ncbi:phage protein, partial [Enterococcus hirae]
KTLNFLDEYEMNKIDRQNKLNEIDYYNEARDEAVQISLF